MLLLTFTSVWLLFGLFWTAIGYKISARQEYEDPQSALTKLYKGALIAACLLILPLVISYQIYSTPLIFDEHKSCFFPALQTSFWINVGYFIDQHLLLTLTTIVLMFYGYIFGILSFTSDYKKWRAGITVTLTSILTLCIFLVSITTINQHRVQLSTFCAHPEKVAERSAEYLKLSFGLKVLKKLFSDMHW